MKLFTKEEAARARAAIEEAISRLGENATDDQVLSWLRQHNGHLQIWSEERRKQMETEMIEEALEAMCEGTNSELIMYELAGQRYCVRRSEAMPAQKKEAGRLGLKRKAETGRN